MEKEMMRQIPFNIIWCIPYLVVYTWTLIELTNLELTAIICISLYCYGLHVQKNTFEDYVQQKIERIEDSQNNKI